MNIPLFSRYTFIALACIIAITCGYVAIAQEKTEVIVSAAASLTESFSAIAKAFESENPNVKILLNFAGAGTLLKQIESGAQVDVFASADQETMDKAVKEGHISSRTVKIFARNELVLAIPLDSSVEIKSLKELTRNEISKIAIGNPDTVPAGRYAKSALESLNLWESLQGKLVLGENVRQVADYISRQEVEAGFIFLTDSIVFSAKLKAANKVQTPNPIRYPIGIVTHADDTLAKDAASSTQKQPVQQFVDFVSGATGTAILKKFGFMEP